MNKNRFTTIIACAAICILTGCVTPYQPEGFTGGYKEEHIRDNLYYVTFNGNAWIDNGTVVKYFHRRAKEVCVENGYRDYHISEQRDGTQYMVMGSGSGASTVGKPAYSGMVECLK